MTNSIKTQVRRLLPKSVRSHAIVAGPLQGSFIYTSWHDYPGAILGTTERPLLEWFRRNVRPGETWMDIGAHYGYTAIALCRLVGPSGLVVAFEPVLSTAECVARTRELNGLGQLQIVPLGLGCCSTIETRLLPVTRGMADSTISRGDWDERIQVASFDSVWSLFSEASSTVHGIKIDVQGMEVDVIDGMRHALTCYKPKVIVEFHKGVDRRSIIDCLRACGYDEKAEPIEAVEATTTLNYVDDKSYAFYSKAQPSRG
jgi:FkbM family methyltransferase